MDRKYQQSPQWTSSHTRSPKTGRERKQQGGRGPAREDPPQLAPVVIDALEKARKATRLRDRDPGTAAAVLSNIARGKRRAARHFTTWVLLAPVLWEHRQAQATANALFQTIQCLRNIQLDHRNSSDSSGAQQAQESRDPAVAAAGDIGGSGDGKKDSARPRWNARQALKARLQIGLSLARLLHAVSAAHPTAASESAADMYISSLLEYLGLEEGQLVRISGEPGGMQRKIAAARALADQIPRKFKRAEDVDEAVASLREAADYMLRLSLAQHPQPSKKRLQAGHWRGSPFDACVTLCLFTHVFAVQRDSELCELVMPLCGQEGMAAEERQPVRCLAEFVGALVEAVRSGDSAWLSSSGAAMWAEMRTVGCGDDWERVRGAVDVLLGPYELWDPRSQEAERER
ncbi:hypothetical protein EV182_002548 [Spiromyces aspiralis]|uniref:Uncharacterized protein n=1 Tax=Spiromyces aspiralis TaxID=68401 RepID=A0ACC1HRX6_9FUNG|nr:hypothetical protein EV182_002548 [Spiromyces aspiralis]